MKGIRRIIYDKFQIVMFQLIDLQYSRDALEGVISARTLEFHHGKHLQAYVDNLNKLIAGTELEGMGLEEIIVRSADALAGRATAAGWPAAGVFNNAGQVLNHEMYFTQFAPGGDDAPGLEAGDGAYAPVGRLAAQIEKQWGSVGAFKAEFEAKGAGIFGSGWVWLQANDSGELSIGQYGGADNPVAHGLWPLLTFDVWEHAYYLDYQNRRAAYLKELWKIVNWKEVERRYNL